jgi:tRNA pseudouridine38-40 synthase
MKSRRHKPTRRPPRSEPGDPSPSRQGQRRLRLDLSFLGTPFKGWQSQARGLTVQDALDEALHKIAHRGPKVLGCSRTDSGVHARRFSAHVDTALDRPLPAVLKGLNANLPPEVRVFRAGWASQEFHARYASTGKVYRYHLYEGLVVPPALSPFVWQWHGALDEAAMGESARLFLGEHDFSAFTTADGREKNTARTVSECRWERRGPLLVLHVAGPSFLHRMVRCIAGMLVAVGSGRLSQAQVRHALSGSMEGPQIPALPAQGLTLWRVDYPKNLEPTEVVGTYPEGPELPV